MTRAFIRSPPSFGIRLYNVIVPLVLQRPAAAVLSPRRTAKISAMTGKADALVTGTATKQSSKRHRRWYETSRVRSSATFVRLAASETLHGSGPTGTDVNLRQAALRGPSRWAGCGVVSRLGADVEADAAALRILEVFVIRVSSMMAAPTPSIAESISTIKASRRLPSHVPRPSTQRGELRCYSGRSADSRAARVRCQRDPISDICKARRRETGRLLELVGRMADDASKQQRGRFA